MERVLHISKYYDPFVGGVEQTAKDCVNALKNRYVQKVICFNHEKGTVTDFVDGVEIDRCGCQLKISSQSLSAGMRKKLKELLREFKPNIVLLHYPNPFVSTLLLPILPSTTKLILYWHLDITKQKILGKVFHTHIQKLIKRANKIVATSPNYIEGSKYLSSVRKKCIVVPSCINEERLAISSDIIEQAKEIKESNKDKMICLALGRHVPYKGFEYLIQASKQLDNRFAIYIGGNGELTEKLKKMAEGDNKIHFLGRVDDATLKAYYCATDIFCFPSISKNEAYGLALAEAMYFGNPAVTFTIEGSGVNYVNLANVTGLEVENRAVEKYAKAMKRLADSSKLREALGKAAKERVVKNFLYSQYCNNILKAFI